MNYLGVDWGMAKIGLATGSSEVSLASPYKVLRFTDQDQVVSEIQDLINMDDINLVIIGQPLSLSGDIKLTQQFRRFLSGIKATGVKVILEDERLSTKAAQAIQKQFNYEIDDDIAAATIILQSYIDRKKNG